jgi:hypothetical protein
MNTTTRILLPIGIILTTSNTLLRDYVTVPDYIRGILTGTGIGLIIWGMILQRKFNRGAGPASACRKAEASSDFKRPDNL